MKDSTKKKVKYGIAVGIVIGLLTGVIVFDPSLITLLLTMV